MNRITIQTPAGPVTIEEDAEGICMLDFYAASETGRHSELLNKAEHELMEYFEGSRKQFDLPLSMHGTSFQMADWKALCEIPYGETRSYKDIAIRLGKPGAARAVGMANHANCICILIPCHRVINADGSLGGFGSGIAIKKQLLELEKRYA